MCVSVCHSLGQSVTVFTANLIKYRIFVMLFKKSFVYLKYIFCVKMHTFFLNIFMLPVFLHVNLFVSTMCLMDSFLLVFPSKRNVRLKCMLKVCFPIDNML